MVDEIFVSQHWPRVPVPRLRLRKSSRGVSGASSVEGLLWYPILLEELLSAVPSKMRAEYHYYYSKVAILPQCLEMGRPTIAVRGPLTA
jgi:hypothetical protein